MGTSSEHLNKYPLNEQEYAVTVIIIVEKWNAFERDNKWTVDGQENLPEGRMHIREAVWECAHPEGLKPIRAVANCSFLSHMAQTTLLMLLVITGSFSWKPNFSPSKLFRP